MRPVSKDLERYKLPQITQLRSRTQGTFWPILIHSAYLVASLLLQLACWPAGPSPVHCSRHEGGKAHVISAPSSSRGGPCQSSAVRRTFLRQKCSHCKRSFCGSDFYLLGSGSAAGLFSSSSILCTQPAKLEYRKLALWMPFVVSPVLVGFCLSLQRKSCPFLRQSWFCREACQARQVNLQYLPPCTARASGNLGAEISPR